MKNQFSSIPGGSIIRVVTDNDRIIPRSPSEDPAVTHMVLNVAHNGTLGDGSKRQNIANNEIGLLATVDELAGVHALGGDEQLFLMLVPERVAEGNSSEWGAATGIVDDLGDHTLEVAVPLAEGQAPEPRRTLAVMGVGLEYGSGTFTLGADDPTHLGEGFWFWFSARVRVLETAEVSEGDERFIWCGACYINGYTFELYYQIDLVFIFRV